MRLCGGGGQSHGLSSSQLLPLTVHSRGGVPIQFCLAAFFGVASRALLTHGGWSRPVRTVAAAVPLSRSHITAVLILIVT